MIDILYILGRGSKFKNNEIRFSLRSIQKHLSNYRNVYIVGECPDFLTDVIHIPMDDTQICKETNIYAKILRACQEPEISDNFIFFNDDHFLNIDFDAVNFPNFYKCDIEFTAKKVRNMYRFAVRNTLAILKEKGYSTFNFDTHTPIIYNKHKFLEVMPGYDWTIRYGYIIKSLYGNTVGLTGVPDKDYKINSPMDCDRLRAIIGQSKVWSIGDKALSNNLSIVLNDMYPVKSKWER